ncbi:HAD-IIB family hydrolase [Fructobacillus ficulneus]|uniref:Hydrolase (HAD superfamily) n=1 Tax=Fructobacillus ficulneus TaxID=157463 RepID=A0A0K8MK66_9LACO|nr:HAD family hydrolase [Fructobacillus ficulneus]GAP00574.1 hydrolase (HAD superfamily) [Fructobacillus ficulneus]
MTIKLIATDLDATFLRADKTFDHQAYQTMVEMAQQRGVTFVVATGNHPDKVASYFAGTNQDFILIANNGAEVVRNGQILKTYPIDPQAFAPIVQTVKDNQARVSMGMVFTGVTKAFMLKEMADLGMGERKAQSYFKDLQMIDDLSEIDEPILKLTVDLPDYELPFMAAIEKQGLPIHVTTSGYGAVDMVNPQINKGVALHDLGQQLGISAEEMAAFGDGLNDLEMLQFVGHPFIMPNADPALFAHGFNEAVTDSNHDGVLKTILTKLFIS